MGKKEIVTRTVLDDDELERRRQQASDDEAELNEGVSLFPIGDYGDEKRIDKIRVIRKEPDEGYLGDLAPDATEQDILSQWGGGVFRVEAKNQQSQLVKVRTVRVAGEPVFLSAAAESRYRRANGLPPKDHHAGPAAMGITEMFALMEERDAKRRAEEREREDRDRRDRMEREERIAKEREERDERRRQDEASREERRRKEEAELEDRRQRLAREDEDRREKRHKEDLARQQQDQAMLMQQQQAMFQQTLAVVKLEGQKNTDRDPVEMLVKGLELARSLQPEGGGEPADPLTTLLGNAAPILQAIRGTADAGAAEAAAVDRPATVQTPKGAVVLSGRAAGLMRLAAAKLTAAGRDPEKVFTAVLAHIAKGAIPDDAPKALGRARKPTKGRPASKPRKASLRKKSAPGAAGSASGASAG